MTTPNTDLQEQMARALAPDAWEEHDEDDGGVHALAQQRARNAAAVAVKRGQAGELAVRELHRPEMTYRLIDGEDFAQEPDAHVCTECRNLYPCDTIEALDAALDAAPTTDEETNGDDEMIERIKRTIHASQTSTPWEERSSDDDLHLGQMAIAVLPIVKSAQEDARERG